MAAALDVKIEKVQHSRLANTTLENIPFGRVFTDHMLEADYIDGAWTNVVIRPYQPLQFDPSLAALHYGQSIFEGVKAYKNEAGEAIGKVTSGTQAPSLQKAVGLGYVATAHATVGSEIYIDIRNTLVKAQVVKFPFK